MKYAMILGLLPATLVGACATIPPTSAELESCRKMESRMGVDYKHDHGEFKRNGMNPMNLSHSRCRQILKH